MLRQFVVSCCDFDLGRRFPLVLLRIKGPFDRFVVECVMRCFGTELLFLCGTEMGRFGYGRLRNAFFMIIKGRFSLEAYFKVKT
jgi:hypothetical protein